MDSKPRLSLVESYLALLLRSLKAQRSIDDTELRKLHHAGDIAGMVRFVRKWLHLELPVTIGFVNGGGDPTAPAWIRLPKQMPHYGHDALKRTRAILFIRRSFLEESQFPLVVVAIAHELCHVVLNAIGHTLREQEEAVDLTAMILGFGQLYVEAARICQSNGSSLGYLTGKEVRHAQYIISRERDRRSLGRRSRTFTSERLAEIGLGIVIILLLAVLVILFWLPSHGVAGLRLLPYELAK
jgi:hypothetical protein